VRQVATKNVQRMARSQRTQFARTLTIASETNVAPTAIAILVIKWRLLTSRIRSVSISTNASRSRARPSALVLTSMEHASMESGSIRALAQRVTRSTQTPTEKRSASLRYALLCRHGLMQSQLNWQQSLRTKTPRFTHAAAALAAGETHFVKGAPIRIRRFEARPEEHDHQSTCVEDEEMVGAGKSVDRDTTGIEGERRPSDLSTCCGSSDGDADCCLEESI